MKIINFVKKYIKEAITAPLFKFIEAAFELAVPVIVAKTIDEGIANSNVPIIIKYCAFLVVFAILGFLFSITAQFFAAKTATSVSSDIRDSLYQKIQTMSFSEIDSFGTSALITRMTSDINSVQSGINMFLRLFLRSPFIVIGAVVMAFIVNAKLALIFAVAVPILCIVVFLILFISVPLFKRVQIKLERVLGLSTEAIDGSRVIRAFCSEEEEYLRFKKTNNEHINLQIFAGRLSAVLNPVTLVIINGSIILLLYFGGIDINIGIASAGVVVALYNYMSQILIELVKLANLIVILNKSMASGSRIEEVLNSNFEQCHLPTSQSFDGIINFSNVSLKYNKSSENSLTDINFSIEKGQTIGIIGRTGSGKSSLINLVPRFYVPTVGTVAIKGKDALLYDEEKLRECIGLVPQKAVLFTGTVRDNMRMGKEIPDEQIIEALKCSDSYEFVMSKDGLETKIEKGGRNLSGGQRQRLTIARALSRRPEILILDDSSSALDYSTDIKIRENIKKLDYNPTIIIVSQRASSVMNSDHIFVLKEGKITGEGTHDELLQTCEEYQNIYSSQFGEEAF